MRIPYRTRRRIGRFGMIFTAVALVGLVAWLCWVVWLERYVVYSGSSATLDFSVSAQELSGEVAKPPVAEENVPIYYNEGSDALNISSDLSQMKGYYINLNNLKSNMDSLMTTIQRLDPETAVMVDLKDGYGNFFYNTNLENTYVSNLAGQVEKLVEALKKRGCYLIARVSAFPDWSFVDKNPSSCLKSGSYGWLDEDGYFWIDPTSATGLNWITSVVTELKDLGFNEVTLADFRFPDSDKYRFDGDKPAALQEAASKLITACGSNNFVLSFAVSDPTLTLPEEARCRIYLEDVAATAIDSLVSKVTVADPTTQVVFVVNTNDSRFDTYSVLRTIDLAEIDQAKREG